MSICHNCGAKLEPEDIFCFKCGTHVRKTSLTNVVDSEPEDDSSLSVTVDEANKEISEENKLPEQIITSEKTEEENFKQVDIKNHKKHHALIIALPAVGATVLIVSFIVVLISTINSNRESRYSETDISSSISESIYQTTEETTSQMETTTVTASSVESTEEETTTTTTVTPTESTSKPIGKTTVSNAYKKTFNDALWGKQTVRIPKYRYQVLIQIKSTKKCITI